MARRLIGPAPSQGDGSVTPAPVGRVLSVHSRPIRHAGPMFALVFGMLVCLVGGMVVMGVVVAQARRDGRDVLTQRGDEVVGRVRTLRDTPSPIGR